MPEKPSIPRFNEESWGPTASAILRGECDDDLRKIEAALRRRRASIEAASGLKKGARVRFKASAKKLAGREGVVEKVNPKTVAVNVACPSCGNASEAAWDSCESCHGIPEGWRVSPNLIEVI